MRVHWISWIMAVSAVLPVYAQSGGPGSDVVMNAMRDEMARSMKQLTVENLEKPYFVSYRVVESDTTSIAASFGALNHSTNSHSRRLTVEVRVGDYKLDSSHLFSYNADMGTRLQIFNGTTALPVEDDYKEIRRQIWLATDETYKKAVQDLSRKRGILQTQSREDEADDFSKEEPQVSSDELPAVKVNVPEWEKEARELSAIFRKMPGIYTSTVVMNCFNTYTRYLTSEGTSYTRRQPTVAFTISAGTQATDGMPLDDLRWMEGRTLREMPTQQEMTARVEELGRELSELREAPTLANYSGPVLVEGDAAPLLFRWLLMPNLTGIKRTINGMPGAQMNANQTESAFLDKVGARVLPEFLSLTDNPTIREYQSRPLAGYAKMDEDGMPSREVKLIENGILKNLLMSRDPVRGFDHSTGSRHAGQATPSNVIVTVSNGLSREELRAKFLDLVKQRNRPFGIAVRMTRNGTPALNAVLAYKVFPDGHEELIRGIQFFGFNVLSFKDVVAASRDLNYMTLRYQPPRGQFGMLNEGEDNFTPVSMMVPSVLFEDVTMRKIRAAAPTPPILKHPFFDK
ncbi:MAG TPA: metallopeptidase TldD-related protein [Bryobacteraceae bacterium]|nr:metallopeptidase TldD-related protein [Bryobacteraceae bacterium]